MKQCWRWFGPDDQVTVEDMLQSGVQGVVTGLYNKAAGQVWTRKDIATHQAHIAQTRDGKPSGLQWEVVESLPVSEAIKTRSGPVDEHIANYIRSMEALGAAGIKTICYNFMPLLDWTRTDIAMPLNHGGTCMNFDLIDFAAFDIYILRRVGARKDYQAEVATQAQSRFEMMSPLREQELSRTICAGLPGAVFGFSLPQLREQIATYANIDATRLRENLAAFLKAILPTAERLGLKLACHPDDPPWPVLGLPRIVSTQADLEYLVSCVKSPANGLTYCSGSLGARADNDLVQMAKQFANNIHFAHLRSVNRASDHVPTSFFEDAHLEGSTDMIAVLRALLDHHPRPAHLPLRPDHGQDILSDIGTNSAPGYPLCGRMKGLAELRGALKALTHVPAT